MISLQVKTSYSMLSSLCHIDKLVKRAKELEYTYLAITDIDNMFGVMEFYYECKNNDIKPIIGLELSIFDNKKILLYAMNNQGYLNLVKLTTLVSERSINKEDLIKYKDNLILIIPYEYYDEEIYNIYDKKYIGFSYMRDGLKLGKDKVYINNVLYINKDDYKYLDYLYMVRDGSTLGSTVLNTHIGHHLQSKEELTDYVGFDTYDVMDEIGSLCDVQIGYIPSLLPVYDKNIDAYSFLKNLCYKGLNKRLNGNIDRKYQERLDYELDVINKMGFCNYFLIVYDYVKYAKQNDILVGPGRGSAAGSLVSYSIGITDIDPLEYGLLFERFLNPSRVTMPDIDIDFDAERRGEVIDYVINKYGEKKVAGIVTFNTFGSKQVVRDVGRVLNINIRLIDEITKQLGSSLIGSYNENDKLKKLINSSNDLRKLYDIALHLENLPRHISIHAAGIVICNKDIDEVLPLYKSQLGMYLCAYSMNYLEPLGLLKMDFLGLSNLSVISNLIKEIREKEKLNITFSNIPLNDTKTLDVFKTGSTDGIFQFESFGMKTFLNKLQISSFEDITLAIALYRPGPMESIDEFIKVRNGSKKIEYITKELEPILKSTYGVIVYQEQIMQIARVLAGYSLSEADNLRRAMSKKKEEILNSERPKFIRGCINNGYSEEASSRIYDLILKFANYGFNRSHSVCYAVISYKMAFLKTYFYKYFITNLLSSVISNENRTRIYICEMRSKNIKLLPPDINESTNKYIAFPTYIRSPLTIIKNIGVSVSNEIINERDKGKFLGFIDFIVRMYSPSVNRKVLLNLINAGVFTDYNNKTLINNLEKIITYAELSKNSGSVKPEVPEITIYEEYPKEILLNKELQTFGFYLTDSPVSKYKKANDINTSHINSLFDKRIHIILSIDSIREITTKNNDVMAFVTGIDEYGSASLILFPDIYKDYLDLVKTDIVRVYGRVEKRFDKYQIVVKELRVLNR